MGYIGSDWNPSAKFKNSKLCFQMMSPYAHGKGFRVLRAKGTFGSDGNIFYLGGGGYIDIYIKIHRTVQLNKAGF